ncbi:hypothetical protein TWF730_001909 [Orbilia blumenaviensis]|uniref:Ubiquitin-like domain-containing protein n=1 Tax=Orbilia blumenaviensis TaxID=1796055 RepID=A0AAV9UCE8_9PEZI
MAPPPLTIILKSHTTTLYLLLPPTTPISTLLTTLFQTLTSTPTHHLQLPIPTSSASLKLGIPRDHHHDSTTTNNSASSQQQQTMVFTPMDEKTLRSNQTLTGLGIRDGQILAFEVVNEEEEEDKWDGGFVVQWPAEAGDGGEEGEDDGEN